MTSRPDLESTTGMTGQQNLVTAQVCRLVLCGDLDEAWDVLQACVRQIDGILEQQRFVRSVLDTLSDVVPQGDRAAGGFILWTTATYASILAAR